MNDTIVIRLRLDELIKKGKTSIEIQLDNPVADISHFEDGDAGCKFFSYMELVAGKLKKNGKERTAEAYRATLKSLEKFRQYKDFCFEEMGKPMMADYEAWLKDQGVCPNTSSFYMRILRAVYNRAVSESLTADRKPFEKVYTGRAKTVKRAVGLETIKQIESAVIEDKDKRFARDMFMFSFYTRGMSFVDMAYLRKTDISRGILTYRRHKTGQVITIRWEPLMQQIVERNPVANSLYLLPIIRRSNGKERGQYRHKQRVVNEALHWLSNQLSLDQQLTMYVARHSWANIARALNISIDIIQLGMGHNTPRTTQIYLKEIDSGKIDEANRQVMDSISMM